MGQKIHSATNRSSAGICAGSGPFGKQEPESQHGPAADGTEQTDGKDLVRPVQGNEPHGKRTQQEVDENQQGGGCTGVPVHLFQYQIVAGRTTQTEGKGDHHHGQGKTPGTGQPPCEHCRTAGQDSDKPYGEQFLRSQSAQQPHAGEGSGHEGHGVQGEEITEDLLGQPEPGDVDIGRATDEGKVRQNDDRHHQGKTEVAPVGEQFKIDPGRLPDAVG